MAAIGSRLVPKARIAGRGHASSGDPSVLPFLDLLAEVENAVTLVSDGAARPLGSGTAVRLQIRVPDSTPARRFRGIPIDEEVNVFVDPSTLLVLRTERIVISDGNLEFRIPAATEYSDYRTVQGIPVPSGSWT